MKKAVIFAAAIAGCLTLTAVPLQVAAAPLQVAAAPKVTLEVQDLNNLKEYLAERNLKNCTVIQIPCQPGTPDTNIPGVPENKPENKPEAKPEQPENKPGDSTQSEHAYVLRVVELVNAERAKAGLNPVTLQKDVTKAAQVRAVEIEKSFSHTRPNGTSFVTALNEAGVSYRGYGENIAWGQKTPEQVMEGWMNSPGHRANILNAKYTSIGVGYHQNAAGTNYWSQLFTY